jgi:transcriptional regulator with XRE-family HTH domain
MPTGPAANRAFAVQVYAAVGRAVAQARRSLSPPVTQADLAERTGGLISRSALANIERGRQRVAIHHLYLIAEALNCTPEDLLPPLDQVSPMAELAPEDDAGDPAASEWLRRVVGPNRAADGGPDRRNVKPTSRRTNE